MFVGRLGYLDSNNKILLEIQRRRFKMSLTLNGIVHVERHAIPTLYIYISILHFLSTF